jgi:hypothetical protein
MAFNSDRSFFSVIASLGGDAYSAERDVSAMSFQQIVCDIADGQIEDVLTVIEFNPVEGWSNDITADVLAEAFPARDDDFDGIMDDDFEEDRIGAFEAGVGMWAA